MSIASVFSRVTAQLSDRLHLPAPAKLRVTTDQVVELPLDLDRRLAFSYLSAFNDRDRLTKAKQVALTDKANFQASPRDQELWEKSRDSGIAFNDAAGNFDNSRALALRLHERCLQAGYVPGAVFSELKERLQSEELSFTQRMHSDASPLATYGEVRDQASLERERLSGMGDKPVLAA